MNHKLLIFITIVFLAASCTSQKKLAYLNNLPKTDGEGYFIMQIPDYKIQPRDILFISVRAMNTEGVITDLLSGGRTSSGTNNMQYESNQYISGYDVDLNGNISLPILGETKVEGFTLNDLRDTLQTRFIKNFPKSTVECKLLSFKFTVIGEVKTPGSYVNYNNFLTVLEAVGRAGGISDYGRRDKILVVRPVDGGTKTFTLNLQDKSILLSEAYFILPNDVIIVEPESKKIFNLNLSTYSFIITSVSSAITSTLLLINYFKDK